MFELPSPILEITEASYHAGGRMILENCNLKLYPSEVLAIVGCSGSGKTSLLNILAGRVSPASCTVFRLNGQDMLAGGDPVVARLWRKATGYVTQDAAETLDLNMSACANIARRLFELGLTHAGDALQRAQDRAERLGLPAGRLSEPVRSFSGGMRQRVQIAAAMVHDPEILFLDEPTSGLDSIAQALFLETLMQVRQEGGTAMILVTHDLRIARLIADRVLVMDAGWVVAEAVTDRLMTEPVHPVAKALVEAMI